jgi:hypothetical protein
VILSDEIVEMSGAPCLPAWVLAGLDPSAAVAWVRKNYRSGAIETTDQESWVAWFSEWARGISPMHG